MTSPEPSTASDAADLAKFGYKESLEMHSIDTELEHEAEKG